MAPAAALSQKTILIVEDDASLRNLYRAAFRVAGHAVVAVEDGTDALRHIEERHKPDAIVLDLRLPRMNGRDVHRELQARAETRDIPTVVVTGTDFSDLDRKKFASILTKPVDTEDLVQTVEAAMRARRP